MVVCDDGANMRNDLFGEFELLKNSPGDWRTFYLLEIASRRPVFPFALMDADVMQGGDCLNDKG